MAPILSLVSVLSQAQIYYDEGNLESAFILDNKFLTYVNINI